MFILPAFVFCDRWISIVCLWSYSIEYLAKLDVFNLENIPWINNLVSLDVGTSQRAYMLKSSINMFLDKPIAGQGLGNWFMHAYTEDSSQIIGFDHPYYYRRVGTHNLYELLFVELGTIGFLLLDYKSIYNAKNFKCKKCESRTLWGLICRIT